MICPSCGFDNIEGVDRCDNCMKPLRDLDVPRADASRGLVRSVMEDDLSHLDHEETLTARPEDRVSEVVRRMKETNASCALVLEGNSLAGIFTEHDVLSRLAGTSGDVLAAPVSELMTPNPEALRETDSIAVALNKMAMGRYRHVPVIRNDGGYAVTSIRHVLKFIAQEDW
jgi:CBS domain-containing protein